MWTSTLQLHINLTADQWRWLCGELIADKVKALNDPNVFGDQGGPPGSARRFRRDRFSRECAISYRLTAMLYNKRRARLYVMNRTDILNNEQLTLLKLAFDDVCSELKIPTSDTEGRNRIASALMALASAGQFDPRRLRAFATSRYEATWPSNKQPVPVSYTSSAVLAFAPLHPSSR